MSLAQSRPAAPPSEKGLWPVAPGRAASALSTGCCLLGLLTALGGCGDDKKKKDAVGGSDAAMDAAVDAGPDAAFFYDVPKHRDAAVPVTKPTCTARECQLLSGDCRVGHCNAELGQCEFDESPDGIPCGDATNDRCTQPDTCLDGLCEPNHYADGTVCDPVAGECEVPDTCDGMGSCVDRGFVAEETPCGDDSATACDLPDSCDDAGHCKPRYAPNGSACNLDKHADCGGIAFPDSCNGSGKCIGNGQYQSNPNLNNYCPKSHSVSGACRCGNLKVMGGHPCPDECAPDGLCVDVGTSCL